jgi:hypothetical protein
MASNENNGKRKWEEEAESSAVRKCLQLFDDDDSSDSLEGKEEVSSEESSMNQLDTSEEKLLAKGSCDLFFSDDGNTTSLSSKPLTPETPTSRVRSGPDGSSNDDDNF